MANSNKILTAKQVFERFPRVKTLYQDKDGKVFFAPNAKPGMKPVTRESIKKKATKKKSKS